MDELAISLGHWEKPSDFQENQSGRLCHPVPFVILAGASDTGVRVLGPADVATTMIYTHVLNKGEHGRAQSCGSTLWGWLRHGGARYRFGG